MIKYRPHKGSLADAMAEAKEFETVAEMKNYFYEDWNDGAAEELFSKEDIVIGDPLGDDNRIGWKNVRHVCVKRIGAKILDTPQCLAWCGE